MKALQIHECYNILTEMESKKYPISMELILLENLKKLAPVTDDIEKKERSIIELYADRDEDGNIVINEKNQFYVSKDKSDEFKSAMDELINTEIEILFDKIQMDVLNRCDEDGFDSLSMKELQMIKDFMM